jgi:DNA processing protein
MEFSLRKLSPEKFPSLLKEIPDPPEQLYYRGNLPPEDAKVLAVVGSRNYSDYGKQAVEALVGGLRGSNVAIVSGLALGIDGLAHQAALDAGLFTLAVPGSGLDEAVLYPRRHRALAREILSSGGGLLSEFEPAFKATTWSFPQRNRIMAGLAHAVLVVEASLKSGTLITSRLAVDYNRDVLTVPGSIFSKNTAGPHLLLRLGATPVTSSDDILEALGIEREAPREAPLPAALNFEEARVLELLAEPRDRDRLIRELGADAAAANVLLMKMEIAGLIADRNGVLSRTP